MSNYIGFINPKGEFTPCGRGEHAEFALKLARKLKNVSKHSGWQAQDDLVENCKYVIVHIDYMEYDFENVTKEQIEYVNKNLSNIPKLSQSIEIFNRIVKQ